MPDTIRATGGRLCAHPRRRGFAICSAAASLWPAPARADGAILDRVDAYIAAFGLLDRHEIAALALTLGVLFFAVLTAILLVRTRSRAATMEASFSDRIAALRAERDRANALLLSESQILVSWAADDDLPEIQGDMALVGAGAAPERVLAFGNWLEPDKAQALERAVDALRARGEAFAMRLIATGGRAIEADGRAIGGSAVLRLRDVSGLKRELAELNARHDKLTGETDSLRALVDALPAPVWVRDIGGTLTFVNAAYARAVEAKDAGDALGRAVELLNRSVRDEASRARAAGKVFSSRVPAIVAGGRRTFDVVDVPTRKGSAGLGVDATAAESLGGELKRLGDAHRRTLDQLATGVAIFTDSQRLTFYNAAYRSLWELDAGFLDQQPTDSAVLDQLRAARVLPEESDFRQWKAALHEAYRATEAKEHLWHLPDRRTIRVVTTPNPQGGVTYLFEDVTERLDMARRYDALIRVQRETLDNLAEAVAVFGSDGRVRLHNPAFAQIWQLQPQQLDERPHIEAVIDWCRPLYGDDALWNRLRGTVTAIEQRAIVTARIERRDGSVLDLGTVPLPDGATLVTFLDVTDTINVERALRERNEALETADALKLNFVHHVSYELRSPLTTIIGFSQLLGEPNTGPLTEIQREYLGYINSSTSALLAIINDILDLASIDAGAMKLNLGSVDVRKTMEAAAEGIKDRLVRDGIGLDIIAAPGIGGFVGDERRIRQILFNLLANAVGFAPPGTRVTLAASRRSDAVEFTVTDHGPGIAPTAQERVFDRFEANPQGSRHRGPGLGLSIVRSLVALHGGSVTLDSEIGRGTTVVCTFPIEQRIERSAA